MGWGMFGVEGQNRNVGYGRGRSVVVEESRVNKNKGRLRRDGVEK